MNQIAQIILYAGIAGAAIPLGAALAKIERIRAWLGLSCCPRRAILYLTFEDIAPQAKLERHWAPPLGAVIGFLVGLVGQMILE